MCQRKRTVPGWLPVLVLVVAGCSDASIDSVNTPPEPVILSPVQGFELREGHELTLDGLVADRATPPEELLVSWASSEDGPLFEGAPDEVGRTEHVVAGLGAGQHTITLTAVDGAGAAATDSVQIVVVPQQAPALLVSSPSASEHHFTDQAIDLVATATDPDDDPEDLVLAWWDGPELLAEVVPDSAGLALVSALFFDVGLHPLAAVLTDPDGLTATASMALDVLPPNQPPWCEFTAPAEGATVALGAPLVLEGTLHDPDEPSDEITVHWESDLAGPLGSSLPGTDGHVAITVELTGGIHVLSLRAEDRFGASCGDVSVLSISAPPTATPLAPTSGAVVGEGAPLWFEGLASDPDDPAESLTVSWTSDLDGLLHTGSPDAAGQAGFSSSTLSPGLHSVSMEVTDPLGQASVAWLTVQVDGRPSAPAASLTPPLPGTGEDLVVAVLTPAVDPEGGPLSYQVDWLRDGLPQLPWSGVWMLPASATSRGQTWTVLLSADDGLNLSAPGTASATVVNTAPLTAPPTVSPAPLGSLDAVHCLPGVSVDVDGDAVSLAVGWTLNGVDDGLSGPSLAAESTELGDLVRCWTEPHDGFVSGARVLSAPEAVVDLPPSTPGLALSPSSPRTTHDLVGSLAVPSIDPEGEPVTYGWSWSVNGVPQPAWNGVSWLPSTATARDELWRVEVVASDGSVDSAPGSVSVSIQNSPPGPPALAIVPDDSPTDLDLHCDLLAASADLDGDPVHYAYSWSLTAGPPLATGSTLPASMTVSGEVWTCSAIPFDGTDTGPSAQATTLVGPPSQFVGFDGTFGTSWQSLPAPIEPSYALDVYHPLEMDWIHNNHGSPPERFDGLGQQWLAGPPSPCAPPWATLAPWDGRLWLARCDAIHAYDPVTELWTVEADFVGGDDLNMTETDELGHVYGYTEAGSIVDYDSVTGSVSYLVTGLGRQYETRLAYDPAGHALFLGAYNAPALHRVDLATGSATALTPIPQSQLGDIFCGDRAGHIYVAGGSGGSSMWQYDIASDSWNPLPDLPADHGDNGSCTVSETGWLYVGTGSLGTFFRLALY